MMRKQTKRSPSNSTKRVKGAKTPEQVGRLEDKTWYKRKMQDANALIARVGLPKEW
jgi:hypothetical protein